VYKQQSSSSNLSLETYTNTSNHHCAVYVLRLICMPIFYNACELGRIYGLVQNVSVFLRNHTHKFVQLFLH
jgi:hypothetical protein